MVFTASVAVSEKKVDSKCRTAERLATDNGTDHVAVNIDITVGKPVGHMTGKRLDARVNAERQAKPLGINLIEQFVELGFFPPDNMQYRAKNFLFKVIG